MAHAQASLVGVILSPQIVTVSRFQNIPKAMVLQKPKLSNLKFREHPS